MKEIVKEILDKLNLPIILIDDDFTIVEANEKVKEMFGNVVGRKCFELVHSTTSPPDHCVMKNLLEGRGEQEFYEPSIDRWLKVRVGELILNGKRLYLHTIEDFTKLKRLEEKIKEDEEKLKMLFENLDEAIILVDHTGTIVRWNPAAERITGLAKKDVVGKKLWDVAHHLALQERRTQKLRNSLKKKVVEFLKTGQASWANRVIQTEIELSNGERKIVEQIIIPIATSEGYMAASFFRDVTDRERLREAYKSLIENSLQGLVIFQDDRIVFANKIVEKMVGYTLDELKSLSSEKLKEIIHPRDRERVWRILQDKLSGKKAPEHLEFQIIKKDGNVAWIEVLLKNIEFQNKNAIQVAFIDITERKRAEEDMREQLMKFAIEAGNVYIIKESTPLLSIEVFKDLLKVGYHGLIFSRTPKKEFKIEDEYDFDFVWIAEKDGISDLKQIEKIIESKYDRVVVLLDRLDYFIIKHGFKKTLFFVQKLREIAYLNSLVVLISVDTDVLDGREQKLLEKETKEVELKSVAKLSEDLFEILRYIYNQNVLGVKPSYSDVRKKFDISKPTATKRIKRLISLGYVSELKFGNKKVLELTMRGVNLFSK